ncbi:hypothetical protein [Streptodolium elevatio]
MAPQVASAFAEQARIGVIWGGIFGPRRFSARLSAVAAQVLPKHTSDPGTCPAAKIASGTPG